MSEWEFVEAIGVLETHFGVILPDELLTPKGTLTSTVVDGNTRLPLRGVTVQLVGLAKATLTDELGPYRFDRLVASPYKVEFSYVGYAPFVQEITVVDDQTTQIQTGLTVAPVTLNTVDDMPVNMVSHAHGQGYADLLPLMFQRHNCPNYGSANVIKKSSMTLPARLPLPRATQPWRCLRAVQEWVDVNGQKPAQFRSGGQLDFQQTRRLIIGGSSR